MPMNREEADMATATYLSENTAMREQVKWFRDMLRRAYALIGTNLDDDDYCEDWMKEYEKEMGN